MLLATLLTLLSLLSCGQQAKQKSQESPPMRIYYATLIDNQTIEIKSQVALSQSPTLLLTNLSTSQSIEPASMQSPSNLIYHFTLPAPISNIADHFNVQVNHAGQSVELPLRFFKFYDHPQFIENYIPPANTQFGVSLAANQSTFRVWSPTASQMIVNVYPTGDESASSATHPMQNVGQGVWELVLPVNLEGNYFTYSVTNAGNTHEVVDPHAISTGVNGRRALITTSATAFGSTRYNDNFVNVSPINSVIYELHVRDVSMSPTTSHSDDLRGKFLGVVERGTTNQYGQSTGFDHIRDLGATHIHLLPFYDYNSINEARLEDNGFNWGYDPLNYSVPEGSYSSNPNDGYARMRELREMVSRMHQGGMGLVMDVVYNHTGPVTDHYFQYLVPDYYFRMDDFGRFSNGSGTGNETDSTRVMFSRYMVDSLKHWANTYKIDGFRFDLMAIHDIDTMNEIARELKAINPNVLLYGEGWHAGSSPLAEEIAALKINTSLMPDVAVFNDDIRDGTKGHVFDAEAQGFVNGNPNSHERTLFGFLGAMVDSYDESYTAFATKPADTIAYVSAHDNHTLYDRWVESKPDQTFEEYMRMQIMANAMVLTSPGIPFLHAGVEIMRTKEGDENSYKSPDSTNQIDYDRKQESMPVFNYHRNLIALRKAHPIFKQGLLANGEHAFEVVSDHEVDPLLMAFRVNANQTGDSWAGVYLFFNAGENTHTMPLSAGNWRLFADTWQVYTGASPATFSGSITLEPQSIAMLYLPR
jgi:pullulanase